jgi:hypothetical protein
MKQELTGFQKFKAVIAKWIVANIAMKISPIAVLSLCLEVSRMYYESAQIEEE